ncbi:MAG: hypothetical protein CVU41_16430 [Chloroflexi bacterium HGW-Chloroflexi-3]|nr:MAG: hypothetical protein CVU41_16430 [Chloroflexi bacterium HGW-Chloroflexi-3]
MSSCVRVNQGNGTQHRTCGYVLLATLGLFLPSFVFVALSSPLIPKLRNSKFFFSLLDGINAVSLVFPERLIQLTINN